MLYPASRTCHNDSELQCLFGSKSILLCKLIFFITYRHNNRKEWLSNDMKDSMLVKSLGEFIKAYYWRNEEPWSLVRSHSYYYDQDLALELFRKQAAFSENLEPLALNTIPFTGSLESTSRQKGNRIWFVYKLTISQSN